MLLIFFVFSFFNLFLCQQRPPLPQQFTANVEGRVLAGGQMIPIRSGYFALDAIQHGVFCL